MDRIKYSGEVNDKGKLTVYQQKTFKLDILKNFAGQDVWVIVEKRSQKMTKSQRGYLFGVVIPRVQHGLRRTGLNLTEPETKIWLEKRFLTRHLEDGSDITGSMKELGVQETVALTDEIIRFAAMELDEIIPYPGEFEK